MSITKEQAINNLTIAKLKSQVDWAMYIDTDITTGHEEHVRSETKYYTLREAYIACGVLTWDEAQSMRKYVINAVE
jgi:hypothetical protein